MIRSGSITVERAPGKIFGGTRNEGESEGFKIRDGSSALQG